MAEPINLTHLRRRHPEWTWDGMRARGAAGGWEYVGKHQRCATVRISCCAGAWYVARDGGRIWRDLRSYAEWRDREDHRTARARRRAAKPSHAPGTRLHPVTPRNSLVGGYDARSDDWRDWWAEAKWESAIPTRGTDHAPMDGVALHVPCGGPYADGAVYRVRPRREGPARAVLVHGVWHWEYWSKEART